jgi:pyruvate/2-oxoglutarate dehydrogenase complex dihydrolipoamide acyltransferase (E2) component
MENQSLLKSFPKTRIATLDTFAMGLRKHHVSALLEFDVTDNRKKLQELRRKGVRISFNAWLIKVISQVIQQHPEAAGYLRGKRKLILFRDVNVSMVVEKRVGDARVPIPLVIEKTNEKSAVEICSEIEHAKNQSFQENEIVLHKKASLVEKLYYHLPGGMRRAVWKILLDHPKLAYRKMGNVVITSVGMMGKLNGWFIHRSVHPISFGIGSVLKKPVVIHDKIKIREILNMTILVDHDLIDGASMVRFLNDLTRGIENELTAVP